jgi:hypothetical protein
MTSEFSDDEDDSVASAEHQNTVVWQTGISPWPYSHLVLPAIGVFLFDPAIFSPLAAVAVITLCAVVLEVDEMVRNITERKSDVIIDLVSAVVGSLTGLAVMYALDVPSWGVFGGVHTWRTWCVVAVVGVVVGITHHMLCLAAAEKHNIKDDEPVPAGPKPYVFPSHVTACLCLLLVIGIAGTTWLDARGVPSRWWHALVPVALGLLAAAPLYIQPDDQENLRWSLVSVGGAGAAFAAVALYRHWPRVKQWMSSNVRTQ